MAMKKITSLLVFSLVVFNSFSQGNYAIWGDDDALRSDGVILRFEVRDKDSRVPISNATIEIIGTSDREIAYFRTNDRGIGVMVLKRVNSLHPSTYLVRITKEGYKYFEERIERDYLKSEKDNKLIILPQLPELIEPRHPSSRIIDWAGARLPSDLDIVRDVIAKNYDIYNANRNVPYAAPGIFEYSILLEQFRNTRYPDSRTQTRQDQVNVGENIPASTSDFQRESNISNRWIEIPWDYDPNETNVYKKYKKGRTELAIVWLDQEGEWCVVVGENGVYSHYLDDSGNMVEAEGMPCNFSLEKAVRISNIFMRQD